VAILYNINVYFIGILNVFAKHYLNDLKHLYKRTTEAGAKEYILNGIM